MIAKFLYREGVHLAPFAKPWLNYVPIDSVNQVLEALDALDGEKLNTLVVSESPGEPEDYVFWSGRAMIVSSNKENGYLCEAYENDMARSVAAKKHAPRTREQAPIVTGQLTFVWRHQIISIDEARTALAAFVEHGQLTDAVDWDAEA